MREIKFRVWDKERKQMMFPEAMKIFSIFTQDWKHQDMILEQYDSIVWLQFTGLQDKNSKEIYEGDILINTSGRKCSVVWFAPAGCWDANALNDAGNPRGSDPPSWTRETEVIGNIYENPELVEIGRVIK